MSGPKLGAVRRIVTGHNEDGRAVFYSDTVIEPQPIPSGDAAFALLWAAPTLPVDNNDPTDGRMRDAGRTLRGGTVIRVVDMLPGCASPMHRTNSIDYGIILSGHLELELDDGATTQLEPGDVVIQRGTMHLWRNPSPDTICRIVFVLVEAHAYRHDGTALPEVDA